MQFGYALLDRFLQELLLSDPKQGPRHMLKLDISDGFYQVNLAPGDIPKLGVIFPSRPGSDPQVALPLVLPMGWKNPPFQRCYQNCHWYCQYCNTVTDHSTSPSLTRTSCCSIIYYWPSNYCKHSISPSSPINIAAYSSCSSPNH